MSLIDFPIIDAHLHLWDPGRRRYPWLNQVPMLNRPYLLEDYLQACGTLEVSKMVFVQCECEPADYQQETSWAASLAMADLRIAGIVSWAPLERGADAEAELEELAANRLVKGVRRIVQFEPDPAFCLRPDFVRGVRLLPRFGFSFDLCLKGEAQTASVLELVRRCPDVAFILDHIGKPFIREKRIDPWRRQMRELSKLPNVCCKLSGLVGEADLKAWRPGDLRPYIDEILGCFGPHRLVFGGDWPVVLQASSLPDWAEILAEALAALSRDERHRVFFANASEFYRLSASAVI